MNAPDFQIILQNFPIPVAVMVDTEIIAFAGDWQDLLNKTKNELSNDFFWLSLSESQKKLLMKTYTDLSEQRESKRFLKLKFSTDNKQISHSFVQLTRIQWQESHAVLLIFFPINKLFVAEEQEGNDENKVRSSFQNQSLFLSNMSHELRTPLNSILGFTEIALKQSESLSIPVAFRHHLHNIQRSGENLLEIMRNILELSRIETDEIMLKEEELNLSLLVQGIYHVFKSQARKKGLQFSYSLDTELPQIILCDRGKLLRSLHALVDNAIKFSRENEKINIHVKLFNEQIDFIIIDSGPGISPERSQSIFVAYQSDKKTNRMTQGLGLGLATVKKIVEQMSGKLFFQNMDNSGTAFHLELPLKAGYDNQTKEIKPEKPNTRTIRILIVEDNEINLEMLEILINKLGYNYFSATNGKEAIEIAKKIKPDIIFMDLHMPQMDGFTATKILREIPDFATIPILALTADLFAGEADFEQDSGITEYLAKPINMFRLQTAIENYFPKTKRVRSSNDKLSFDKETIREQLNQLTEIPYYLTSKIIQKITDIENLLTTDKQWDILSKLRDAVFEKRQNLIKEYISQLEELL